MFQLLILEAILRPRNLNITWVGYFHNPPESEANRLEGCGFSRRRTLERSRQIPIEIYIYRLSTRKWGQTKAIMKDVTQRYSCL